VIALVDTADQAVGMGHPFYLNKYGQDVPSLRSGAGTLLKFQSWHISVVQHCFVRVEVSPLA
jgi:hypothetical protein